MDPDQTGNALVLTQGDPEGIGPELLLRLAAEGAVTERDCVVADLECLQAWVEVLATPWAADGLQVLQPRLIAPGGGRGQLEALVRGVDLVLQHPGRALVTAPMHKASARAEGFAFPGHTEYLAERAQVRDYAMAMIGPTLRVVLVTTHIPLRTVPERLSTEGIVRAARLLADGLSRHFAIHRPRVGVLGLNPHAGEQGLLGEEDDRVVAPAVSALSARYGTQASFVGPVAADTAFHAHLQGHYDGLVALYHDQGLAPFKLLHFDDGVNMTLGLPFVRTSPDHGTARDIAGTGRADPSSMRAAIELARKARS